MQVQGIDHATIRTPRLEQTRAFFEQVLGLRSGPAPSFAQRVVWLYADGRDVVHLVAAEASQAPATVGSINHFALRVADYEGALAELKAKGVPFETDATPGGELRQIYLTDPNGVRIELNCPGPGARR
jgi:catechol 2,3-dioxygenase-like lactoylglutathione lyase family enzyme